MADRSVPLPADLLRGPAGEVGAKLWELVRGTGMPLEELAADILGASLVAMAQTKPRIPVEDVRQLVVDMIEVYRAAHVARMEHAMRQHAAGSN